MNKHLLAQELKHRQYATGKVPRQLIDSLTDDEIIKSYTTCADCGKLWVSGENLRKTVDLAHNANHFLNLCKEFADHH